MRIGDQLTEGLRRRDGLGARVARGKAIDMLEAVQIRDPERVLAAYPHELSGGMGQRVMIAMMLIPDPDLLIADEPTSALDVTVQAEVLRILDDLVRERGLGLLFISHDLQLVSRFCDRVMVMYKGRVMEELAAADLDAARHPYTRGLLNCLPKIGGPRGPLPVLEPRRGLGGVSAVAMIEIDELSVTFAQERRRVRAVRDVSFAVEERESFGLVGESGSGKSTILRAICGLAPVVGRRDPHRRPAGAAPPRPRLRPAGADGLPGPLRLAAPQAHRRRDAGRVARPSTASATATPACSRRWPTSASTRASASATRTSSPAASASASPSPAR